MGFPYPEAATVFGDPMAITFFDSDHSDDEDRFLTFGHSNNGVLLIDVKAAFPTDDAVNEALRSLMNGNKR